jgi:hypothetical protein
LTLETFIIYSLLFLNFCYILINMNLLRTVLIIVIAYYAFKWMVGDVYEGYCSVNSDSNDNALFYDSAAPNRDMGSKDCSCSVCKSPKCGGCLGNSATHLCGWNNSVSGDDRYNWAPENMKGQQRVFKYPHYYGYGTGSGFHYGEPYYVRTVDY